MVVDVNKVSLILSWKISVTIGIQQDVLKGDL